MKMKRVCTLYYSATGNTACVAELLAKELAAILNVPQVTYEFTKPQERREEYVFDSEDLVVVGTPTYAGKIPNKLLPDFQIKLKGNGALAIAVVTFGGRNYDHALAELCTTLDANGFSLVAGGAFACQHAFSDTLQKNRPDGNDRREIRAFAKRIAAKMENEDAANGVLCVPGDANAPYYTPLGLDGQPAKFLKAKPVTNLETCNGCGLCAELCPMGAIEKDDVSAVTGVCIKCQACVKRCPAQAKFFDDPAFLSHVAMLEENYQTRKDNEIFL